MDCRESRGLAGSRPERDGGAQVLTALHFLGGCLLICNSGLRKEDNTTSGLLKGSTIPKPAQARASLPPSLQQPEGEYHQFLAIGP